MKIIAASSLSGAWCSAVQLARGAPDRKVFHLTVNIANPTTEERNIRTEVDELLRRLKLQSVETVANTILPSRLAASSSSHAHLVDRYRASQRRIGRFPGNTWGTYFGRLVAYPVGSDRRPAPVDQLGAVIRDLQSSRVVAAQYETVVAVAGEAEDTTSVTSDALIHHPSRGSHGRGGPCLSYVAFQREGDTVHAVAHYRSQYLIERAYGNYLGLGRLMAYVAERAGLHTGQLTVVAGYAQVDNLVREVDRTLQRLSGVTVP